MLAIDLDKAAEDKQDAFASGVIALAQSMGCMEAVSAKQCIQPRAGFHEARTTLLTPAQNLALDALMPVVAYAQL